MKRFQIFFVLISIAVLFDCSTPQRLEKEAMDFWPRFSNPETDFYVNEIQPLFNRRCVVCHTCTNAPCQLHLDSYEGIRRGSTHSDMGSSYLHTEPTRDKDAKTINEWRRKSFFPVIPDPTTLASTPSAPSNAENSLLYQFIKLGSDQNKEGFDLTPILNQRGKQNLCFSDLNSFRDVIKSKSFLGMPYGLPSLSPTQIKQVAQWIENGAPAPNEEYLSKINGSSIPQQISAWESLFHRDTKSRLMARYIFEHVFSAHIHFEGSPNNEWYELVRSRSEAPNPVDEIVTERPYDDPKTKDVYYRFKRFTKTLARPSHIPWEISNLTLNHYKSDFFDSPWTTADSKTADIKSINSTIKDPGYKSINPFNYFSQIPASIRYQFLLENSQLIANAMIRGPACSGRVATHAIRDHFWVFFLKPESDVTVLSPDIGKIEWIPLKELELKDFEAPSSRYTKAMAHFKPKGFDIRDLWNGHRQNLNATLTVMRHGTNASVHHGLIGGKPPTMWVLNYSNFERIYYNLVADFQFWGSAAHKAATWNYMSRHRSEAEERFISFLPEKFRSKIRSQWTQGIGSAMNFSQAEFSEGIPSQVVLRDEKNPVGSLLIELLKLYDADQINPEHQPVNWTPADRAPNSSPTDITTLGWDKLFHIKTMNQTLQAAKYFPDVVFLNVQNEAYTLVNHRFYRFNNILALEKLAYSPENNSLFLLKGLVGDRPEFFAQLTPNQAQGFVEELTAIQSFQDWNTFKNKYFIRRNNPKVWELSDWFIDYQWKNQPLNSGIFDLRDYDVQTEEGL